MNIIINIKALKITAWIVPCLILNIGVSEETLKKGGYDMVTTISVGDHLMKKRNDHIACLDHANMRAMSLDFAKQIYQKCGASSEAVTVNNQSTYTLQCMNDVNQPIEVEIVERFDDHSFEQQIKTEEMSFTMAGQYVGECYAQKPPNVQEKYEVTAGYYDFKVTTKANGNVIKIENEKQCIRSGEQVIGGILNNDRNQNQCTLSIESQSKNYFVVNISECKDMADGGKIHFSTMSKARTLSVLFEVDTIKDGEPITISQFKMGHLIGECPK